MARDIRVVVKEEGIATFGLDTSVGGLRMILLGLKDFDMNALPFLANSGIFVVAGFVVIILISLKSLIVILIELERNVLILNLFNGRPP